MNILRFYFELCNILVNFKFQAFAFDELTQLFSFLSHATMHIIYIYILEESSFGLEHSDQHFRSIVPMENEDRICVLKFSYI